MLVSVPTATPFGKNSVHYYVHAPHAADADRLRHLEADALKWQSAYARNGKLLKESVGVFSAAGLFGAVLLIVLLKWVALFIIGGALVAFLMALFRERNLDDSFSIARRRLQEAIDGETIVKYRLASDQGSEKPQIPAISRDVLAQNYQKIEALMEDYFRAENSHARGATLRKLNKLLYGLARQQRSGGGPQPQGQPQKAVAS